MKKIRGGSKRVSDPFLSEIDDVGLARVFGWTVDSWVTDLLLFALAELVSLAF